MSTKLRFAFGLAALGVGCAGSPTQQMAQPPTSCSDITAEAGRTLAARDAAMEDERDAWKAIVPFAVIARHALARENREQAEAKLASLVTEQWQLGCPGDGS